ncbi:MAG: LysR substrate-binding domain-containing protein [Pseudoruegeria sp.]
MNNLTLKQLRYFEALAKHAHFGRAAEASAITQPALSMQIRELEETLGSTLFERGARKVRLTSFGETFAHQARNILRSVEELEDLARAARDRLAGRLRIGIIPTIAPYLLPQIIHALSVHFPDIDLRIRETQTEVLLRELSEGRLDSAILALPVSEPAFTEVPLFSEAFVLVRHESEVNEPVPPPELLTEMQLLLLEEGHCFRDQALSFCTTQPALARDGLDASSLATLVQMVGAGIGITLIPEMAILTETKSASVCISRFQEPQPTRSIGMIWRKTNPLAQQLNQIADVVKNAAK